MPLTSTGFVVEPLADILARVRSQLQTETGRTIDYDGTPEGGETAVVALQVRELQQGQQAVWDGSSWSTAVGGQLDVLGERYNVARDPATRTTAYFTVVPSASSTDTVLPAGTLAQEVGGNGTLWRVRTTVTVNDATPSTQAVQFEANTPGPVTIPKPSDLRFVRSVAGFETEFTYPGSAADPVVGQERETDAAYRARGSRVVAVPNQGGYAGLRRRVLDLDWVTAVSFARPASGELAVTVVPTPSDVGSWDPLDPTAAPDTAQLAAILGDLPPWITLNATDNSITYRRPETGEDITVEWDDGTTANCGFALDVTYDAGADTTAITGALDAAFTALLGALDAGQSIDVGDIIAAASTIDAVRFVTVNGGGLLTVTGSGSASVTGGRVVPGSTTTILSYLAANSTFAYTAA